MAAATSLARQTREKVIPEVDTHTYNVMCTNAGHKPNATVLTKDNIYTEILKGNEALDIAEVPETGRILVVTPQVYTLMKQCPDITMETNIGNDMRIKGVISNMDGCSVIKVPANRLPSDFGFMIAHPIATVAPTKLEDYRIHQDPPGISGALIEGRICYDAFVLENKKNAIYYQAAALNVVSSASNTTGKTAIVVTPDKASGNSYKYKTAENVELPEAGTVCTTGWTVWNGTDEITATNGNIIAIVEVDSDNKAIKSGKTTVISKA